MNNLHGKIIAVDFDGTLCEHKYPEIGDAHRLLIDSLITYQTCGAKLILWTCREGELLREAISWCSAQGLIFDAVNQNLPEIVDVFGSDARKIFADVYLDDRACKNLVEMLDIFTESTMQNK